jgi:Fic family protein
VVRWAANAAIGLNLLGRSEEAPRFIPDIQRLRGDPRFAKALAASRDRVRALVANRTQPANRSEQEIAGYRDVLGTIHSSHQAIEVTPNVVLQLHRDLFRFVPGGGGRRKPADNQIAEHYPDGTNVVRFTPVAAHAVPRAMDELSLRYARVTSEGGVEPLLVAAAYVLDFLCIHPFSDGNGRIEPVF